MKHRDSVITITGYTVNKEPVVAGIWSMYETHGLPLDIIFDICIRRKFIPDWIALYKDMRNSGMKHDRILSKLQEAINDSYGREHCEVVISKLEEIFKG